MRNVASFEARSSLRTWLIGIVMKIARKSSASGRRTATCSDFGEVDAEGDRSGFDANAFLADGHWREAPWHWSEIDLERGLAGRQVWDAVEAAVAALPPDEAAVIRLRDVEGLGPRKTEDLIGIGKARQRTPRPDAPESVTCFRGADARLRTAPGVLRP